jgi:hypothetical protein
LRVREFVPLLVQILASIRSIVSRESVAVVLTRSPTSSAKKLRAIPSRIGARLPSTRQSPFAAPASQTGRENELPFCLRDIGSATGNEARFLE